ncbi:BTAD domain-containing putative transcriptional regulator [Nonomuraea sp. NPDC059194]|uniref:BTAD domain-containing putative transcriptional regulator n=1 Tax=Nonomuraea sp. NPDC059194 TaxID=3346764 RepID=UPI003689F055
MRFEILGPARVRDAEGRPVAIGGPRVRALLVLLAMDAGRVVTQEHLIDGLYGAEPPETAANALQSQVSRLRRALGRDLVEFHPAGYRLAVEAADVDAHRFELLTAQAREAMRTGDPARAATLFREALDMWRGTPLADAPLAEAAATRLVELRLSAVEDRVQAELELGAHRELAAELRELVAAHPLRERLRAQLMRALYGSGRQAEALAAYEEGRRILDDELGVTPGSELAAAHLAVLRADPSLGPARRPEGDVSRKGLRAQLTSFVGRADDLDRVQALLEEARLVTLIGPGGSGKTRLATEAAAVAPRDVCFVELAPISDEADLAQAVVSALDLRDSLHAPDRIAGDAVARLVAALAERRLLLVLDNCEHLVAAAAALADRLLAACPHLRLMATSREALGITGESIFPVAPLRLPPPGAPGALDYPAVRLFADRAAAVRPGFTLDAEGHVIRICRALDGLPLAIELAAARLRSLSVAEVAARLDDRFRLLARGSRTALPRHQTLRAVVAWSWELLDADEQAMARRLTVFVGGATLEAAERVCGLPEELLTSLVEKSLVEVVNERYRMLETIRAFCAERLAEAGEVDALRRAHAAHYLDLAVTADPHLRRAEQLEWLALLDEERDDLHAALRWSLGDGDTATALTLVGSLGCYWWFRGRRAEGAAMAAEVLAAVEPGPTEEYAMCVLVAAWADHTQVDLGPVRYDGESPFGWEFLNVMMPMFHGPPDNYDMIATMTAEAIEELSPWMRGLSHAGLAFMRQNLGMPDEAWAHLERSLEAFRALGERWGSTLALSGMADLAYQEGDHAAAVELAGQAEALAEELGAVEDLADFGCRKADAVAHLGDLAEAEWQYLRVVELATRTGARETLARAHLGLGGVAMSRGELTEAKALMEQALKECPTAWYSAEDTRMRIMLGLGEVAQAAGDVETARHWYTAVLTATHGSNLPLATKATEALSALGA